jgi:hypothetical protein
MEMKDENDNESGNILKKAGWHYVEDFNLKGNPTRVV